MARSGPRFRRLLFVCLSRARRVDFVGVRTLRVEFVASAGQIRPVRLRTLL